VVGVFSFFRGLSLFDLLKKTVQGFTPKECLWHSHDEGMDSNPGVFINISMTSFVGQWKVSSGKDPDFPTCLHLETSKRKYTYRNDCLNKRRITCFAPPSANPLCRVVGVFSFFRGLSLFDLLKKTVQGFTPKECAAKSSREYCLSTCGFTEEAKPLPEAIHEVTNSVARCFSSWV